MEGSQSCMFDNTYPSCSGRMVNLVQTDTVASTNLFLPDKQLANGSTVSRSRSDLSTMSPFVEDKVMVSECKRDISKHKCNVLPMKMLLAQEMSKELNPGNNSPNLIAKLMGLDSIPHQQNVSGQQRNILGHHRCHSEISISNWEQQNGILDDVERHIFKDVREVCNKSKDKCGEAKRMSMEEKLRKFKQFEDALEVLNSNKELFLRPNTVVSQQLNNIPSLRPSTFAAMEEDSKRASFNQINCLKGGKTGLTEGKKYENSAHSTRIVVLKPSNGRINGDSVVGFPKSESSAFRNGYLADESSCKKSNSEFTACNLSDSEVISRHSWDHVNRLGSPYSVPSYSKASHSPESSVCREAKKRLSERWSMMASNGNEQDQRSAQENTSTLGEMLALSQANKAPVEPMNLKSLFVIESRPDEHLDCSSLDLVSSKCITRSHVSDQGSSRTLDKGISSSFRGKFSSLLFTKNKKNTLATEISSDRTENFVEQGQVDAGPALSTRSSALETSSNPNMASLVSEVSEPRLIKNQDMQSPVSVLDTPFEKIEQATRIPGYLKLERRGSDLPPSSISSSLIDKSPIIDSIARTPLRNNSRTDKAIEELSFFLNSLLSIAGLQGEVHSSLVSSWYSPESPLDPLLRNKDIEIFENGTKPHEAKRRQKRSMQKLAFDCINAALIHITGSIDPVEAVNVSDDVFMWINSLFSNEIRCGSNENGSIVDDFVRKEVVWKVWNDKVKVDMDCLGMKIGGKLMEELVEETVIELTGT